MGKENSENRNTRQPDSNFIKPPKWTNTNVHNVNSSCSGIRVLYTNADQLMNKLNELYARIQEDKPRIVGITEVKPKNPNCTYKESEFNIIEVYEYKTFSKNLSETWGRGLILYIDPILDAREITLSTPHQENLFVEIELLDNDRLLVGLIYRSPSTAAENYTIHTLIIEACSKNYTHILLMGDFNLPNIDWKLLTTKTKDPEATNSKFVECIQDNFLHQHIHKPTRWRGDELASTLDLILTNEEGMIEGLIYQSPLGNSDHTVLVFNYLCYTEKRGSHKIRTHYKKADFIKINKFIKEYPWDKLLHHDNSIDKNWDLFLQEYRKLEEEISKIKVGSKVKRFR